MFRLSKLLTETSRLSSPNPRLICINLSFQNPTKIKGTNRAILEDNPNGQNGKLSSRENLARGYCCLYFL